MRIFSAKRLSDGKQVYVHGIPTGTRAWICQSKDDAHRGIGRYDFLGKYLIHPIPVYSGAIGP